MAGLGGARPGAGRKPGSKLALTRADAERIRGGAGETPLDVMAATMRELWQRACFDGDARRAQIDIETAERACSVAKDLAPYLHPKLQSIQVDQAPPQELTVKVDLLAIARQISWVLGRADAKLLESITADGG